MKQRGIRGVFYLHNHCWWNSLCSKWQWMIVIHYKWLIQTVCHLKSWQGSENDTIRRQPSETSSYLDWGYLLVWTLLETFWIMSIHKSTKYITYLVVFINFRVVTHHIFNIYLIWADPIWEMFLMIYQLPKLKNIFFSYYFNFIGTIQ